MNLLDKLLEKAGDQVEKHGAEWVGKAFDAAPQAIEKAPEELKPAIHGIVGALAIHREALSQVAPSTFAVVTSRLALGHEEDAKIVWLRDSAPFAERMAAREQANASTLKTAQDSAALWSAIKDASLDVLKVGGQVAIPLLLALL